MSAAQGSPEWLLERCGLATASCFSDVMAKIKTGEAAARRNYRAQLVVERLTGIPTEQGFISQAMRDGTEREPFARMEYEARTGVMVQEVGLLRHATLEAGASPDGLIEDDGGLEMKCPLPATHFEYLRLPAGAAPSEYVAQIQGGMWITGRQWWDFVSYHPAFPEATRLIIRRIKRDNTYIDRLSTEVAVFLAEVSVDVDFARNYKEPQC